MNLLSGRIRLFALIVFFFIASLLMPQASFSQDLESPQYRMQVEQVTIESGTGGSCSNGVCTPSHKMQTSDKELLLNQGYTLKQGYLSSPSVSPSVVSLSKSQIDLSDKNPTLTIHFQGELGTFYQVNSFMTEPLHTLSGLTIPSSHCDHNCTATTAQPWTKPSSYGFGYTMLGNQIPLDFKQGKQFRPFVEKGKGAEVMIMSNVYNESSQSVNGTTQATLQLKLNSNQPEGSYETIINLTALPSY